MHSNANIKTTAKTSQFILFQNKAYHEDNLINTKCITDTKMKDWSHIVDANGPSKKSFNEKERGRGITNNNTKIIKRIFSIIHDKNEEIAKKYRPEDAHLARVNATTISYHPCTEIHEARTLSFVKKKNEDERIYKANKLLLERLKNSKPCVPDIGEIKKHTKNVKKYAKNIRAYDNHNRPKSVICIYDRNKLNPKLEQCISRHEGKTLDVNISNKKPEKHSIRSRPSSAIPKSEQTISNQTESSTLQIDLSFLKETIADPNIAFNILEGKSGDDINIAYLNDEIVRKGDTPSYGSHNITNSKDIESIIEKKRHRKLPYKPKKVGDFPNVYDPKPLDQLEIFEQDQLKHKSINIGHYDFSKKTSISIDEDIDNEIKQIEEAYLRDLKANNL